MGWDVTKSVVIRSSDTHMYTNVYMYSQTYTNIDLDMHIYGYIPVYTQTHTYVNVFTHMYTDTHTYT